MSVESRTVQAMLNTAKKNDYRKSLHYAWIDSASRQCACDGFCAYRFFKGHHVDLEHRPDDAGDPVDLNRIFPSDWCEYTADDHFLPLEETLVSYLRYMREKYPHSKEAPLFHLGNGVFYNAKYLLDIVRVFGSDSMVYYKKDCLEPFFVVNAISDGALMPCKLQNDSTKDFFENCFRESQVDLRIAKFAKAFSKIAKKNPDYSASLDEFAACFE